MDRSLLTLALWLSTVVIGTFAQAYEWSNCNPVVTTGNGGGTVTVTNAFAAMVLFEGDNFCNCTPPGAYGYPYVSTLSSAGLGVSLRSPSSQTPCPGDPGPYGVGSPGCTAVCDFGTGPREGCADRSSVCILLCPSGTVSSFWVGAD